MVVVRLIGGLANQMFPYAAGRRLAHFLGAELKLDVTGFADYARKSHLVPRAYGLGVFNIQERFATPEEIARLKEGTPTLWDRLLARRPKPPVSYIKERHFHFDPRILALDGDIYLDGNWNSPNYFADVESLIRNEFVFKNAAEGKNRELLDRIETVNAVSIHLRRGDYVTNPKANEIHGVCGLAYYLKSVDRIGGLVENPHFFIFSDDPQWAVENLKLPFPQTIVDHNGIDQGHEDLRLMSRCRHNIIANSGFSWWAAWLNANPDKIVMAPKQWFRSNEFDDSTLIPAEWLRL